MSQLFDLPHCMADFTDPGSPDCVLRLHWIWKNNHQTEETASWYICSTGNAVGLLQNTQKVWYWLKKCLSNIWNLPGECEMWISLLSSLRPGSCYETAMTRKFYHGRTETMRPCTQESVKWCEAMTDPKCDVSICVYVRTCTLWTLQKGTRYMQSLFHVFLSG